MSLPALSPDPRVPDGRALRRRATGFVMVAALLFAACNVAWRFGEGSTASVVAIRAGLGAVVAWAIARRRTSQAWWRAAATRSGRQAVLVSAATLLAAAAMFRSLDGPLAGLALACTPAVALLLRDRVGPVATWAALGSSTAAVGGLVVASAGRSETADVGWLAAGSAIAFVGLEVWSMRASQQAVEDGLDPASLVTATMVVAAVALAPLAVVQSSGVGASTLVGSAVAAVFVALFGTVGRVLRTSALPAAGVPAVASSAQVTALGTAVGGLVVVGDGLTWFSAGAAVVAAGLGTVAVIAATSWRLARDGDLATSLRPALAVD
jgi:hypothetical protein